MKELSLQSSYIKVLYAAQNSIVYIRSEVGSKGFLIAQLHIKQSSNHQMRKKANLFLIRYSNVKTLN